MNARTIRSVAVIAGARTPFCKAGGAFIRRSAVQLGAVAARETMLRAGIRPERVDQIIFGIVSAPVGAPNIAREIGLWREGDLAMTGPELTEMSDEDRQMFLEELGQTEPGLARLIRGAFKLLGLQTYFTAGVKEVRAWTIHIGDTAPQAAGVIHGDFERGFIRAQTIAFDDFIAYKGEQGAKDAGKMRAEGKEYVVKDGDVLNFLFNV